MVAKTLEERFISKSVPQPSGCVEWSGHRNEKGYGRIGTLGGAISAHRLAWKLAFGEIPNGLCVCHSCDNPPCVNVEHLWLGTHADNAADKVAKGRQSRFNSTKTHCKRGHPFNETNTYKSGTRRYCRACWRETGINKRRVRKL